MQSRLDGSWYEEDDPEEIEIAVGIDGAGVQYHSIPVAFLDQEFETPESRRQFIQEQLESMARTLSVEWRDSQ